VIPVRKCGLLAAAGVILTPTFEATPRSTPNESILWGRVVSTIGEAETGIDLSGKPGFLLLGTPLSGESTVIQDRLTSLASKTGLIVGASFIEEANGNGAGGLALILVGPDRSVVARGYVGQPIMPITGVALARTELSSQPEPVSLGSTLVGIAGIGDAAMAIGRLADRGANLILLVGGPANKLQIDRLAKIARLNRVAFIVAAHCARHSGCVPSAFVDSNGEIDLEADRSHAFHLTRRWSPASAKGLPNSIPQPSRNDYSPAMAELGRAIFFDRSLSDAASVSCASCHDPSKGFADGRALGTGVQGRTTNRNVISLLNVAFRPALRWDGYASSLENFIKYPLSGHSEMDSHKLEEVAVKMGQSPDYQTRFAKAFGKDQISFARVEQALATYMRTLVSGDSAFDRAQIDGERNAMTSSAWRGYDLFNGRSGCSSCHSYSVGSPFFTDFKVHNTGLGWDSNLSRYRDKGSGGINASSQTGSFRTPTLRDVARTAPYMHDGSLRSLREVIEYFDRGGGDGPGRDPRLRPLHLSEEDKQDLEAFIVSLTGTTRFDDTGRRTDQ
jgi:cytochrome c peroxidase